MLLCESATGGDFQIAFKLVGAFTIGEGNGVFNLPLTKLGSMGDVAVIMCVQACFQVIGQTGAKNDRVVLTRFEEYKRSGIAKCLFRLMIGVWLARRAIPQRHDCHSPAYA